MYCVLQWYWDSAVCGQRFPYFCPETKVPKILHSKGEMARFGEFSSKLSNFDLLSCNKLLLRCRQNLHAHLKPTTCRQTCADFSPSPWWLTTRIWRSCEIRILFVKRQQGLVTHEALSSSCRKAGFSHKVVRFTLKISLLFRRGLKRAAAARSGPRKVPNMSGRFGLLFASEK